MSTYQEIVAREQKYLLNTYARYPVAMARGNDKEPLARKLGASHYIDSQTQDPAAELTKAGGARIVLATVTSGEAMTATVAGLAPHGTLMVLGAPPSLEVSAFALIVGCRSVRGSACRTQNFCSSSS